MRNTYSNMRGGSSGTMIMIVVVMLVCMSSIMMCMMGPLGGLFSGLGSLTQGAGDLVGGAASGAGKALGAVGSVVSGEAFEPPSLETVGTFKESDFKPATEECDEECQKAGAMLRVFARAPKRL
jgi:hypothetical protein